MPADGPIPAHLLGNLWAQDWSNVYDLVGLPGSARTVSLSDVLRARKVTPVEMTRFGERFFTSLGFEPLPPTFWERSLFVKPRDREVVCHASAWNINSVDDLRFKMCIDQTEEDFTTIHHELGHNFYSRAYAMQPPIFRDSANDGFHEAIGDTIALSVTPEYLGKVGLIERCAGRVGRRRSVAANGAAATRVPAVWAGRRFVALAGVQRTGAARSVQPRLVGFAGTVSGCQAGISPGRRVLRPRRQVPHSCEHSLCAVLPGLRAPVPVPPRIDQGRGLHRAAASVFHLRKREAGKRLKATLEMGASRPWPDALEALTGQREMDASAMADYYAPLKTWLDEQNKGRPVGW